MTSLSSNEQLTRQLTKAFPALEPSRALAARIDNLVTTPAQEAHQKAKQRRALRFIYVMLCLLVPVASFMIGFLTYPSRSGAELLERMGGAMRGARSAHIVVYDAPPVGDRVKEGDVWYQDGKWNIHVYLDGKTTTCVFRDGRLWLYTPSDNTVTIQRQSRPFIDPTVSFDFTENLTNGEYGPHPAVQDLGETTTLGRPSHQISVISDAHERFLFSIDPKTDLPFHKELQRQIKGRWMTQAIWDFEYNRVLPKSLFLPNFPKNAHVIDKDTLPLPSEPTPPLGQRKKTK